MKTLKELEAELEADIERLATAIQNEGLAMKKIRLAHFALSLRKVVLTDCYEMVKNSLQSLNSKETK